MRSTGVLRFNIALALAVLTSLALATTARAAIGSMWVDSVTDTSIEVSWSPPAGNYQLSGSTPSYMICWKVNGTWGTTCGSGAVATSNATTFVIPGLAASQTYKIRVKAHSRRQNLWGNWVSPKWRTVAVHVASTTAPPIPAFVPATLNISGSTATSLDVSLTHNDMPWFNTVRICYKKKWHPVLGFESNCQANPVWAWTNPSESLGWLDVAPSVPLTATLHPVVDLKDCRRYVVVAFGGLSPSQKIGEAQGNTGGLCGFFNMSAVVVADHTDDVLAAYAERLNTHYRKPLFDHLAQEYDGSLYELREIFRQNHDGDLSNTATMLTFLIETDSPLYAEWQTEPGLVRAGLALESFVANAYPELYRSLEEELR